ncbi:antitoxin VbhA family protein [Bradyrhizobium genosp. A]|uniref:antitoxin VbhA family protein n=1 Tax=Bradyrhizobium genosp. A TaxID=83626 RepID=UPI003CF111D5
MKDSEPNTTDRISAEERARRKVSVDYARGSVRLEGFVVSSFFDEMNQRYIDGEISGEELTAAILAHHKQ